MKKIWYSLRFRLVLFVMLAALPALGLILYTGFEQRAQAAAIAQNEALRLARVAAVNQESIIENTRGFLIALAHTQTSAEGDCASVFSHLLDVHFPYYTGFYQADLEGNILCSTPGERPEDLRQCIHYQEIVEKQALNVSEYHFCKSTGKAVISIGYPVKDSDDNLIGVTNVGIDIAWFNQLAADAQLPPGSTLTVLDHGGVVLAHYPDPENWVGRSLPDPTVYEMMVESGEGTTELVGADGVERLYAFTTLWSTEGNVFVSIGIPSEVAYAEAERTMVRNLVLLGIATLLALLAAWLLGDVFIVRQTQALVGATQQLAAGELETRTNIPYEQGEIGQLARAFDQMAESLEQREHERDQAEAAMLEYAAELERSNRDLQDFANITAHDLQEPLRKIQIYSDMLQTKYDDQLDERGQSYLGLMHEAARRMQDRIDEMLAYSRVSTKPQAYDQIDLNEVVERVIFGLEHKVEDTGAEIDVGELPVIEADSTQMDQLFQNLIGNALKFHKANQPPVVKIESRNNIDADEGTPSAQHDGQFCQVSVADNGIGFDEKYLDRIFMPFQRLHGRKEYDGSGMGLTICRRIVERHGGDITATSTPGKGSTFVVTLPIQQPKEGAQE
jgi:signal transduction histidine kinase